MAVLANGGHDGTIAKRAHYAPPWADVSIIGIAGSSGSGKSTLSQAIVNKLNLPWVVILSIDSFYKTLDAESHKKAFLNEYDFDSPEAIDFDVLVDRLRDLKAGKRAEIPVYSFEKHARLDKTTAIYSPHVLILEGIFALYDPRVLELLDMRIFCEADADTCLSRRILRDVRDRGRDISGIIKQWFSFVKPNFEKYVDPQRKVADIIVPRGVENHVAMSMVVQFIEQKLLEKSTHHRAALTNLEIGAQSEPLSKSISVMPQTSQLRGMNTIIRDIDTSSEDFIFYFDRFTALLVEQALNNIPFAPLTVTTPQGYSYAGLKSKGNVSAVIVLRGGAALETGLRRVIPDCKTGRVLIQSNIRTGEPELHFLVLPEDIAKHEAVLLLDAQMSSGGSALMAVQVLVDHGVKPERIVLATYSAGRMGLHRLTKAFPEIAAVVGNLVQDVEESARSTWKLLGLRQTPPARQLSGAPLPQTKSRLVNFAYRTAAVFGTTIVVFTAGVVAFFLYDASTYKIHPDSAEIHVSQLALNPRRGGPKNLPILEVCIDDDDDEEMRRQKDKPKLVILGGGWGSVALLKELNPDNYHVTVVSPVNYFLFTPMLPSSTVGTLSLRALVEPIRRITHRVKGHYVQASAEDVDFSSRLVEVSQINCHGQEERFYIPYDKLVIGVGSVTNAHGVKGLEHCNFLKTIDDAREIRNKVIQNLELACLPTTSDDERRRLLSFVVCGGGPTGVEFAAELFDLLNEDLTVYFPRLLRNEISVHLIQSRDHILNTYDETLSKYAEERFARDQVAVLTNSRVREVREDSIVFTQHGEDGSIVTKELPMGFCLWSTGVSQTEFARRLAKKLGDAQTNQHALETDTHLRVNGTPLGDVYAIGDCSTVQNNITDHIVTFLRVLAWKHGKDPENLELRFEDWRNVAAQVRARFPQAAGHLKRLDRLFSEYDKDQSGTLDFGELRELLKQIDNKLTSLPATAQRAHQQGQYLAHKFNKLARAAEGLKANEIIEGDLDAAVYKAFEYKHLGSLAYIGNSAVLDLGQGVKFAGGLWAVYAWRSIYFAQSVSFRTRVLMAMDWAKRALFGRDLMSY
ncbi:hypothetical protein QBC47DRAFT_416474 [Echria macrotheca]|uniref:Uridine kinase n=1 Tax=Echria macrotheca TaxID=438768 RepID=A0AAJ0F8B3_9PEZI|nr:hypothetical protein QBC47DRAFT_416474 [Echria macrotheca]